MDHNFSLFPDFEQGGKIFLKVFIWGGGDFNSDPLGLEGLVLWCPNMLSKLIKKPCFYSGKYY